MTEISNATKKAIEEKIIELNAPELINYIRTNYSDANLGGRILGLIFEKICGVNKKGFSKAMSIDDLAQINNGFRTTNGSSWARSNGSYLGDGYIVRRNKQYGNHGRIISVQLDGINHNKKINRTIPKNVQEALKGRPCCVLNIHSSNGMEIDHKNAKLNVESDDPNEYQVMSKAVNDAKRQHCKTCMETGKRFDATILDYPIGWTMGDADSPNCPGCYWYDPRAFNAEFADVLIAQREAEKQQS